jgi:hypothetical protein
LNAEHAVQTVRLVRPLRFSHACGTSVSGTVYQTTTIHALASTRRSATSRQIVFLCTRNTSAISLWLLPSSESWKLPRLQLQRINEARLYQLLGTEANEVPALIGGKVQLWRIKGRGRAVLEFDREELIKESRKRTASMKKVKWIESHAEQH